MADDAKKPKDPTPTPPPTPQDLIDVHNLIQRDPYSVLDAAAVIFSTQTMKDPQKAVDDTVNLLLLIHDHPAPPPPTK